MIFIFHFNRGEFLENLIKSVEKHSSAPVVIFDDRSDDIVSIKILDKLSAKYEIIRPDLDRSTERRTGGLHANMSEALVIAEKRGVEFALMMQDDMQIVRDITDEDIKTIRLAYKRPMASFGIVTSFFKKSRSIKMEKSTINIASKDIYEISYPVENDKPLFESYADTGFFSVRKYKSLTEKLLTGEENNQNALRALDVRLGFLTKPFMHFTPMPISFRSRARGWRAKLSDKIAGAGVHTIASIDGETLQELFDRDPQVIPYAENFLTAPTLPPVRYWPLHGGKTNLKASLGWKYIISRILWAY